MTKVGYKPQDIQNKDPLKDSPVRVLGYFDDIAAATKPLVEGAKSGLLKSLPGIAYIPATAYMAVNVVDKFKKGEDGTGEKPSVKAGVKEALYQGAVNVLAPIGVVKAVSSLTKHLPKVGKFGTFAISIGTLLALSKPIDKLAEKVINKVADPILGLNKKKDDIEIENKIIDEEDVPPEILAKAEEE